MNQNMTLASKIKKNENLVFFRTYGWIDSVNNLVYIPVHGWIYEPEKSTVRKALFASILRSKYGLSSNKDTRKNFDERVNLIISDNERRKKIRIKISEFIYDLPESTPNGHIQTILKIPCADIKIPKDNILTYTAEAQGVTFRRFTGECRLLAAQGHSVISDIDDTVKITQVTNKKLLLENTFFKDFNAVPGMASLYQKWQENGSDFHFVSSSPWYLYSPLVTFLNDHDFPWATLSLKSFRFKDRTLLDLFKKGTETKPKIIRQIIQTFPQRRYSLVGDSGEEDAEAYARIAEEYPEHIQHIYIRYITSNNIPMNIYHKIFRNIPREKWTIFKEMCEIDSY